jgi:diguanylate cyclase (GGDEF)-like protein
MTEYQVICIDDDEQFLASLEEAIPDKVTRLCDSFACVFDFVATPAELKAVEASRADSGCRLAMVISDQVMPGLSGLQLIEDLKSGRPDLVCVLLTGHTGLESAKYAINHKLLDQYISKPIDDLHAFAAQIANLLRRNHSDRLERERTAQLAATVEKLRQSNERIKAMHLAAERVAMLAKSLKALDFGEVMGLVTTEIPRIFGAQWSSLCFPEGLCPAHVVERNGCPSPDSWLLARPDAHSVQEGGCSICGEPHESCIRLGGKAPDIIIPLTVGLLPRERADREHNWPGYLCMCQIESGESTELLAYKGELVREILSTNLTNARLYEEARRQSQTDVLTGVCSRSVLEDRLAVESERAIRYPAPFCLAIVDVDNFKSINDTCGHAAGDAVLRGLAQVLRQEVRSTDVFARYGGDEFVVLMPETHLSDAAATVERMRIRAESLLAPSGHHVQFSCGVAEWLGTPEDSAASVLRRADASLYEAKRSGRNRVICSAPMALSVQNQNGGSE